MLELLRVGIFKFVINGPKGLDLPSYHGSTLRGAFGHAFKQIACVDSKRASCHECEIEIHCPYAYVFETTSNSKENGWMGAYDDVPRPFMFVPQLEGKTYIEPNEELEIEVRLFGKGIEYLPYFVLAFNQMGEQGLGYQRKKYNLKRVISVNPVLRTEQLVYEGEQNKIFAPKNVLTGSSIFAVLPEEARQIRVNYLTPLRIKEQGRLVQTIEFSYLLRSLVRRASALLLFHHGIKLELNFGELIERSQAVKRVKDFSQWYEFERYSNRQEQRLKLGGVIGDVTYEGDLGEFIPLLEFGRWSGAGKNNVFGLGQMEYMVYI